MADGADAPLVTRRRRALDRLSDSLGTRFRRSAAWGDGIRDGFSDLRFADANRVPFPFAPLMRRSSIWRRSSRRPTARLHDLDGGWTLDVSGSYGVNVAGFDRYKTWIESGWNRVKDLGPVLGPLHPIVADNIGCSSSSRASTRCRFT